MNININSCIFLCISLLLVGCERNKNLSKTIENREENTFFNTQKINGVNLVATSSNIDSNNILPLLKINANSVAIVPFGFVRSGESIIEYNLDWQWHGERKIGTIEQIQLAHNAGLQVLLKPHLWIHDGWVGDLEFDNEADWNNFEESYTRFIIDFAQLADSLNAKALCIGVELKQAVRQRSKFWMSLIDTLRTVYSGKLTYAANWDHYATLDFWHKLDFIGVEAYFPLSESITPTQKELLQAWNPIKQKLKSVSNKWNKPILFTEYGYRNMDYTAKQPWDMNQHSTYNDQGQVNGYSAIFETFWEENWFAGGYLWKWHPNHQEIGSKNNNLFTPQNKPAEETIRAQFGKQKKLIH